MELFSECCGTAPVDIYAPTLPLGNGSSGDTEHSGDIFLLNAVFLA